MNASRLVPIPARMAHLPLDPRGFPVPHVVLKDSEGAAYHFAVNDHSKVAACAREGRCHICGTALFRGRWYVGGPLSAFHRNGAYFDGGMHDECAHFALKVCPWLAAPKYARRIDVVKSVAKKGVFAVDTTTIPMRPPLFVAVMAIGEKVAAAGNFLPTKPYRKIEFWRAGERVPYEEGARISAAEIERLVAEIRAGLHARVDPEAVA